MHLNPEKPPSSPPNLRKNPEIVVDVALRERFPACSALGGWYNERALQAPAPSPDHNARPQWMMILKMSSGIRTGIRSSCGRRPAGGWPLQLVRAIYPYYQGPYQVAVVLGRGKLAKIEVALSKWEEYQVKLLGEQLRKEGACRGLDIRAAKFVSRLSEFQIEGSDVAVDRRGAGGREGAEGERAKSQSRQRRQGSAAGGKGTRLLGEGEDQLAADTGAGSARGRRIDRVEWAKQLVGNAVRSPHTRQAYEYALEQFFVWAAGRAISRESVQGYVTWLGEMKFSPSTINQRLAAIRKLASEAQRCGYVDSETAQAIITVAGVSQKGRRLGRWLAWEEARTLLQAPNPHSIRGMRDRALLAVLVTCALRRGELSRMNCEHLAMRDGRWVFLDFKGKGNKTRSVAVPLWVKQEIDGWLDVAGIEKGPIFRRVLANGRVGKNPPATCANNTPNQRVDVEFTR